MKKCSRCGTPWQGYGEPRPREICDGCGSYLHSCRNCHHFSRQKSRCELPHTIFNGSREDLNFCDDYRILDTHRQAAEDRVVRAKATWEELFKRW